MKHLQQSVLLRKLRVQLTDYFEFLVATQTLRYREHRNWRWKYVPQIAGTVVSLTTMPGRIERVKYCVRSLLSQSVTPEKIVLYVGSDKLAKNTIPTNLSSMQNDLFEIRVVQGGLQSYDKILPALQDFPDHVIVTCDDDKIYPQNWLSFLLHASEADPRSIICHFARELPPLCNNDKPRSYIDWSEVRTPTRSYRLMPIGTGGVLYPRSALHADVSNVELVHKLAPRADDLWLKFMSLRAGTKVNCIARYSRHAPAIPVPWHTRLSNRNVYGTGNVDVFERLLTKYFSDVEVYLQPENV